MLSDAARQVVEYLRSREWPGAFATTIRRELAERLGRRQVYAAIWELEDAGVVEVTYGGPYGAKYRVVTLKKEFR